MNWGEKFVYVLNRTALGLAVLLGFYSASQGRLLVAAAVFFVLVPLYFYLHDRLDAP